MATERLKKLAQRRQAALQAFNTWEEAHPPALAPEAAISAVSFLFELLPKSERRRPSDGEGIRRLHEMLSHLTLPAEGASSGQP